MTPLSALNECQSYLGYYEHDYISIILYNILERYNIIQYSSPRAHFSWWGCYGLRPRHKPTEFAHSFYSVLVSVSVFMALSTVFHSMNSPDISPLSHSVRLVLFCLIGPFNYISLYESLLQP